MACRGSRTVHSSTGFDRASPTRLGARGPRVLLWPDTFNNHFHPDTAIAATDVLEAAGCDVTLPAGALCCGRPLYDYGFLERAKGLLRNAIDALRPEIEAGTPIVVLEPSCYAVFRDELVNLFPDDPHVQKLSRQTFLLADFLRTHVPGYTPPRLSRRVMLHGHCHHKAIATLGHEEALARDMTTDLQVLDSGCCGMAGSFGFERNHFDVSMQIGELVLLPAVRHATADTLIIADGFSCREQIEQGTGRRAVHVAHALRLAMGSRRRNGNAPVEDGILPPRRDVLPARDVAAAALS